MQRLRLPAREESLPQFRQFVLEAAGRVGLDMATQQRVELVLEEALVNIIRHAYAGAPESAEAPVEVSCGPDADGVFRMALADWGPPFDPVAPTGTTAAEAPQDPLAAELEASLLTNLEADLEHRALGGMGLFLIRTMSQAAYARVDNANVLTLRFAPMEENEF